MNTSMVVKTEQFLKQQFEQSQYFKAHPTEGNYRLEHSYRVANLAREIARQEGFDETYAVMAGLLHDVAYAEGIETEEAWLNHGRRSAAMARPFLTQLHLPARAVNEICYGIAIHVDDQADFDCPRTPFCETVGDADNIDRYDAYRIYETLQYLRFSELALADKQEVVRATLERLHRAQQITLATKAATALWQQRLTEQIAFYERLKDQLEHSAAIL